LILYRGDRSKWARDSRMAGIVTRMIDGGNPTTGSNDRDLGPKGYGAGFSVKPVDGSRGPAHYRLHKDDRSLRLAH
jgi:hypothetical protein